MKTEKLVHKISNLSLNIVANHLESMRINESCKNTFRVYEDGVIGVTGSLGTADWAALEETAKQNLSQGIPYPETHAAARNIDIDATRNIIAEADFVPQMKALLARLAGYDSSIEEASMDLGANRLVTFFEITLPVLAPGILGGALLAFTLSIDDVIISYFVYGQTKTYPLKVMESVKSGVAPDVNALSTLILVGTILFVVLTQGNLFHKKSRQ